MAYNVAITDDAARDLDELYAHAHLHDPVGTADLLLDRMQDVFQSLAESPESDPHPRELRELGVRDYRVSVVKPYRIVYRVDGDEVNVLLIADTRRDIQLSLQRRLLEP
jgi:toxin ParE1/3/4